MKLRFSERRLLPITICVMATLLTMKSVSLVRAAVPTETPATAAGGTKTPMAAASASPSAGAASAQPGAPAALTSGPAVAGSLAAAPAHAGVPASSPGANGAAAATQGQSIASEPTISDSERALLLDLRHRREQIDVREAAVTVRETMLGAAETRLTARLDELTALQTKLEALDKARQERDEASWAGLVKVYETMKPRDAATIFNDLDMQVLLPVVDRMKAAKAALVLAAMQPDRARLVTAQLAQMRSRANAAPGNPTVGASPVTRPAG
jgi:flagellar motility protein MotE (MotC chaperone)